MSSDYTELPLHLEHLPEGTTIDLWITFTSAPHPTLALKDVTAAIRNHGWWLIEYTMVSGTTATALIEASTITMFTAVERTDAQTSNTETRSDNTPAD